MSQGVKYMLYSTFFFSFMQLLVKKMDYIPFFEIIFFRAIISCFISGGMILQEGVSFWGNNKKLLLLRGLFGTASLTSFFYALHHVPLGSAITIVNIKPFLIARSAAILIKLSAIANSRFFNRIFLFCQELEPSLSNSASS